ncbi:PREDICTED: deoxycytidylate deaminase isoform X2 [Ceratosolen solmsi marchali]|uniref:dCMP deaminase n=1 Tax=Ceratosolen solmsi marchali TaxID=326594 RepID=A0AAJ6YJU3_9HYME|nr:PREDICTED: deoxycytidylate deaminase isoform X2 [Ceratosolen solmsi marchali]
MTDEHNKNKIKHNDNKESTIQLRNINSKREDFLEWNDYFMAVAFLAAMRSKDPCTQVGACIVNEDKKIVGIGYNVCHAELNAILNKNAENIKNCTLYVGLFPCNECAKVIIQSGIKIVYYISDKHASKCTTVAAKRMFDAAKVEYRQYKPKNEKIIIDFNEINWNEMTQLPSTPLKDNRS